MLSRDTAVLGPDGQLLNVKNISRTDEPCGSEMDTESNLNSTSGTHLTCSACESMSRIIFSSSVHTFDNHMHNVLPGNATFSTKKTLTFHVKSKHMAHQMNYPCPCCTSVFTNRASVHRHLVKGMYDRCYSSHFGFCLSICLFMVVCLYVISNVTIQSTENPMNKCEN